MIFAGKDLAKSMGVEEGAPLLIAVFAPSQGHTSKPQKSSAICVYSVKDIEAKFNENIHMCFNGSLQYRNMAYISGTIDSGNCPKQGSRNVHSFCHVALRLSGPSPAVSKAAIRLPRTLVTSVQATAAAAHTVAFLGTSSGTIKKVSNYV